MIYDLYNYFNKKTVTILIYFSSFFRRLKFKSSFYFALLLSCIFGVIRLDLYDFLLAIPVITLLFQIIHNLILFLDLKKKTGIKCKLCSYNDSVLLYPAKGKSKVDEKGSYACSSFDHGHYPNIYFCPVCKNGFLETLLEEKFQQTKEEGHKLYEEVVDDKYVENLEARYVTYDKITDDYADFLKDKDVLEIGSYYGVFYEKAHKVAKSYKGIEPSRHACEFLTTKHPEANIINNNLEGALQESQISENSFDTIVLWDVIEHLPDPIQTLRKLNKLLKKDGHVIFSTINMEASFALALGPKWPWFMDMHYYYFSDRGYVDMLHRSGYVMLTHDHFKYYVYLSYFVEKVFSLLHIRFNFSEKMRKKLQVKIPIQLGDTVLVIGKKEELT